MKYLFKSKWTSIQKLNGWMHYEVLNVLKKEEAVEMFCVSKSSIKIKIQIKDLKDRTKWITGWVAKEENKLKIFW